jgi:hypothetical protein
MLRALVVGAGTLAATLALIVLPAAVSAQGTPTADQYVQPGGGGAGGVQDDEGPNGNGGSGSGGGGAGDVGGQGGDSPAGGDGGSAAAGSGGSLPLDEPSDGGLPFTGSQLGVFAVIAALLLSLALLIRAAERWYARRTA